MIVALPPSVPGQRRLHEPCAQPILQIALQDTLLDQNRPVSGIALVVHIQRSAAEWNRSIIDHGAKLRSHFMADQAGKCRRLLSIEVGLETVTNRLVQEDAWPARTQHHFHRAGRCINGS